MKKLSVMFLSAIALTGFAQSQKVAVYITAAEGINDATKRIVGNELVTAIVSHPDYSAIERASEFLNEIQKEQDYQRSGHVDDQQIQSLGKQFGASLICVADIMPYKEAYYIQARLLNIETAIIESAAHETTQLNSINDIVTAAESLASKLVGQHSQVPTYSKEYSTILKGSENCDIISIDNTDSVAIVTFKYMNVRNRAGIRISPETYIIDNKTRKKYCLLDASGISNSPKYQTIVSKGITCFTLFFEKLPDDINSINIIDPSSSGWKWEKITLIPFGRPNYYEFQDNTETKYDNLLRRKDMNDIKTLLFLM